MLRVLFVFERTGRQNQSAMLLEGMDAASRQALRRRLEDVDPS